MNATVFPYRIKIVWEKWHSLASKLYARQREREGITSEHKMWLVRSVLVYVLVDGRNTRSRHKHTGRRKESNTPSSQGTHTTNVIPAQCVLYVQHTTVSMYCVSIEKAHTSQTTFNDDDDDDDSDYYGELVTICIYKDCYIDPKSIEIYGGWTLYVLPLWTPEEKQTEPKYNANSLSIAPNESIPTFVQHFRFISTTTLSS